MLAKVNVLTNSNENTKLERTEELMFSWQGKYNEEVISEVVKCVLRFKTKLFPLI